MAHRNGDRRTPTLFREINKRIGEVSGSFGPDESVACLCMRAR